MDVLGILIIIIGSACRFKVVGWLMKRHNTPNEAQEFYFQAQQTSTANVCVRIDVTGISASVQTETTVSNIGLQTDITGISAFVQTEPMVSDVSVQTDVTAANIVDVTTANDGVSIDAQSTVCDAGVQVELFDASTDSLDAIWEQGPRNKDDCLGALSRYFSECSIRFGLSIPNDFLILATKSMQRLKSSGRTNVVYNLAKCVGTTREDGSDSRFPSKRMPMGLVEYTVNFFVTEGNHKVRLLILCAWL